VLNLFIISTVPLENRVAFLRQHTGSNHREPSARSLLGSFGPWTLGFGFQYKRPHLAAGPFLLAGSPRVTLPTSPAAVDRVRRTGPSAGSGQAAILF